MSRRAILVVKSLLLCVRPYIIACFLMGPFQTLAASYWCETHSIHGEGNVGRMATAASTLQVASFSLCNVDKINAGSTLFVSGPTVY